MKRKAKPLDIPLGRVELFGQVLHIIEHDGRLVAACTDEAGDVVEALTSKDMGTAGCRDLMRRAIDLLLTAAEEELDDAKDQACARERSNGHCQPGPR